MRPLPAIEAAFERLDASADQLARRGDAEVMVAKLTPREREVLDGLAEGDAVVTRAAASGAANQTSGFRFRMF